MNASQSEETPKKTTATSLADLKELTETSTKAVSEAPVDETDQESPVTVDSVQDQVPAEVVSTPLRAPAELDSKQRNYARGGRKEASARVWLMPGKGEILVNRRPVSVYFSRAVLQMIIRHPFELANREGQYDVVATVRGGGKSGQAGAVRHGIAHALAAREPELRSVIKKNGLLTRDSRAVERKKYGLRKARRSFQFSKR